MHHRLLNLFIVSVLLFVSIGQALATSATNLDITIDVNTTQTDVTLTTNNTNQANAADTDKTTSDICAEDCESELGCDCCESSCFCYSNSCSAAVYLIQTPNLLTSSTFNQVTYLPMTERLQAMVYLPYRPPILLS